MKFSIEEAAVYLGVSERTLANWRCENTGPDYHKPTGKLIYYFKDDLDKWIRKNEQRSDNKLNENSGC